MKQVLAISLSLLMLTNYVGLTFNTHYCGGKAVKTTLSIGLEDLDCGMIEVDTPCKSQSESSTFNLKKCCKNTHTQVIFEDEYNTQETVLTDVDFQFIAAFIISYINNYSVSTLADVEYSNYPPPLLAFDIPVLIQSFLI